MNCELLGDAAAIGSSVIDMATNIVSSVQLSRQLDQVKNDSKATVGVYEKAYDETKAVLYQNIDALNASYDKAQVPDKNATLTNKILVGGGIAAAILTLVAGS